MSKILLVDDSEPLLGLFRRYLERADFAVITAMNSQEALQMAHRHVPAAVVTDIHMPGTSGVSLIVALKKAYPRLPVIAMSGYGNRDVRSLHSAIAQIGADDFLEKPISREDLLACVRRHL